MKIFKNNEDIKIDMMKTYDIVSKKLNRNNCSFSLKWIARDVNKVAHNQTYSMLKRIRKLNKLNVSKDDILIGKKVFCELLSSFNKSQISVILYLLNNENQGGVMFVTQKQLSENLKIPIVTVNRIIKKLAQLKILEKLTNGKYLLLI